MITRTTEPKSLVKRISSDCKCRFDGTNVIQAKNEILINLGVHLFIGLITSSNKYIYKSCITIESTFLKV